MGAFFITTTKGIRMTKIYLYGAIIAVLMGIYLIGHHVGRTKCTQEIITKTIEHNQTQTIKKEKINAETYRTGMRDIRDILRTKYTIAD